MVTAEPNYTENGFKNYYPYIDNIKLYFSHIQVI